MMTREAGDAERPEIECREQPKYLSLGGILILSWAAFVFIDYYLYLFRHPFWVDSLKRFLSNH